MYTHTQNTQKHTDTGTDKFVELKFRKMFILFALEPN
jgi:hypothetical protein